MPTNFKRYTVSASTDNTFKVLRWNDNWNAGWGSGFWITSYDGSGVWSLPYTGDGGPYSDIFLKSFGASQRLSVVTRTDNSNETEKFGFMKTSAAPINISSVSGGTTAVGSLDTVAITINLSGSKCPEEYILVRYTTNDWTSSSLLTATGGGTSYTATIPAQSAGTTVKWYALTSTVAALPATENDIDFLTLSVINNTGSNYSYAVSGDFSYSIASGSTTVATVLGGSGNLTKTGAGELVLTGTNTYTGITTISAGTLRISADSGLGAAPGSVTAGKILLGTGTLALNGAFTLNSNRGMTLTNTGATLDDYGNAVTYNGIIAHTGTVSLTK